MQSKQGVVKIALIDSGIDYTRTEFRDAKLHFLNECKDHIGHGTAVASIIHKVSPEAELYIYRLLDEETVEVGSEQLTDVLNYLKQFKFDVIHLSCGVITSDQLKQLEHSCTGLINEGAVIVSAYDDYGRVSYPAAFENVIGVDWDIECSDGLNIHLLKTVRLTFWEAAHCLDYLGSVENTGRLRGRVLQHLILPGLLPTYCRRGQSREALKNCCVTRQRM